MHRCLHSVLKDAIQLSAAASAIHWSSFRLPKFVQLLLTFIIHIFFLEMSLPETKRRRNYGGNAPKLFSLKVRLS